ncbi:MAG: DNA polymerase III subunit delta, partial [Alphaproteobacteria bacterium]
MKISPRQVDSFLDNPGAELRAALFFGGDEGLVRERASRMAAAHVEDVSDAFCVADLSGPDIIKDPARLADEANALSLTGGPRLVRLRGAADGIAEALDFVLGAPTCEALIVIEAGSLTPRGALRKLIESNPLAGAVGCYADEGGDVAGVIRETLRDHGLTASPDALGYLAGNLGGDRRVIRSEIEKLALYAADRESVNLEDAQAAVADSAGLGLDDVVMAAAEGDHAGLDRALGKLLLEGAAPVTVLRAAARHLQRLHQAGALVAGGRPPREAMATLRPPVF